MTVQFLCTAYWVVPYWALQRSQGCNCRQVMCKVKAWLNHTAEQCPQPGQHTMHEFCWLLAAAGQQNTHKTGTALRMGTSKWSCKKSSLVGIASGSTKHLRLSQDPDTAAPTAPALGVVGMHSNCSTDALQLAKKLQATCPKSSETK